MAQPTVLGTRIEDGQTYKTYSLQSVGAFKQRRIRATQNIPSGLAQWEFATGTAAAPNFAVNWRPYTSNNVLSYNTFIPTNYANGARYNTNSGGVSGLLPATTANTYYTFNISNNASSNNVMQVLETAYNPVAINTVAAAPAAFGGLQVNVTTSATPAAGEYIYVRYTTSNFTTSNVVQASGTGTQWSAQIPWQNAPVTYYVYTSPKTTASLQSLVNSYGQSAHDMSTLALNNNNGLNYNWSPAVGTVIVSSTGGSFATPQSFASLTLANGAFAAINSASVGTQAISILITADINNETGATKLNASTNWNSLQLRPSGVRSVGGLSADGAALFDWNGADNVTIDGLNDGNNSLTLYNTSVSNVSGTCTFRYYNGATSNTITNCNVLGSTTMSVSANGGVIYFATDGTTTQGNDNNTISNCNIGPVGSNLPSKGIYGNGSATTTALGNSGIVISNNNIYDCFSASVTSSGIYTNGGCNNWTITGNRLYQTAPRVWTANVQHVPISIQDSQSVSGAQGFVITQNVIGYANANGTGTYTLSGAAGIFRGILFNGLPSGQLSTINNNTISNISITGVTTNGTSNSSPCIGIYVKSGLAQCSGNVVGSMSDANAFVFSTTTTTATDVIGIYNYGLDDWTSNNNQVGGFNVTNLGTNGTLNWYGISANTSTTNSWTASGNTVGGANAASVQLQSSSPNSQCVGMNTSNAAATLSNNLIRNMLTNSGTGTGGSMALVGIQINGSQALHNLQKNTVYGLQHSAATGNTTVCGIYIAANTSGNSTVNANLVHSLALSSSGSTATVVGLLLGGGKITNSNNMIRLGIDANGNAVTTGVTIGISETSGSNSTLFNSVYIGGSGVSGSASSYALRSTVTTGTRQYRNNILTNFRANGTGTGSHYAIQLGGTGVNPSGLTCNNNLFFVSGTGGQFGFYNNANVASFANWKTTLGSDANSAYGNPAFLNPTANANAVDLHINAATLSPAESIGVPIAGTGTDFDGDVRNATTPDAGADEFSGCAFATSAILSGDATICQGSSANVAVDITGGTAPFTLVMSDGTTSVTIANYLSGNPISVSPSSTSTYQLLTVTGNGGCLASGLGGTATINVVLPPSTAVVAPVTPLCATSQLGLQATVPTQGQGVWSLVDGPSIAMTQLDQFTSATPVFTPANGAGTYTLRWTVSQAPCAAQQVDVNVVVYETVPPTVVGSQSNCQGATVAALQPQANNIQWYDPTLQVAALTDQLQAGTYLVSQTVDQCESIRVPVQVSLQQPVTPQFTVRTPICEGATLTALPTTSLDNISGSWSPALDNTQTMVYTFTPDAGQCATPTTLTQGVQAWTTPQFAALSPQCAGAALTALPTTSAENISGQWSPALDNTQSTTYTFTPDAGQCAYSTTLTQVITPWVTPQFEAVSPVCTGTTLSALPSSSLDNISGSWSPALDNTQTTTYTFTPDAGQCAYTTTLTQVITSWVHPQFQSPVAVCAGTVLAPLPTLSLDNISGSWSPALDNNQTTTYTFTPDAGQCAYTATLTQVITPWVTPQFETLQPVCAGTILPNLPTTSAENISGSWSPVMDNTQTTTYTFIPDSGQCAVTTTLTQVVTPWTTPQFAALSPVCVGTPLTALPTQSIDGFMGVWSPALDDTQTTTYTFTPNAGQCAQSTTLTQVVLALTQPQFEAISPICAGGLISLPNTALNQIVGDWSPAPNPAQTTTYTFTPMAGQCADSTQMTVQVIAVDAPTGAAQQLFTEGQTLQDLVVTGTSISWYASLADALNLTQPLAADTLLVDGSTYYAMQSAQGCNSSSALAVQVTQQLNVNNPLDPTSVVMYPVPVRAELTVQSTTAMLHLKVYNALGQLIWEQAQPTTGITIDAAAWPAGSYVVAVWTEKGKLTRSIVKR